MWACVPVAEFCAALRWDETIICLAYRHQVMCAVDRFSNDTETRERACCSLHTISCRTRVVIVVIAEQWIMLHQPTNEIMWVAHIVRCGRIVGGIVEMHSMRAKLAPCSSKPMRFSTPTCFMEFICIYLWRYWDMERNVDVDLWRWIAAGNINLICNRMESVFRVDGIE